MKVAYYISNTRDKIEKKHHSIAKHNPKNRLVKIHKHTLH